MRGRYTPHDVHDREGSDGDLEPSLGSSNEYHGKGTRNDHIAPANIARR
jgi:hypothetical protein